MEIAVLAEGGGPLASSAGPTGSTKGFAEYFRLPVPYAGVWLVTPGMLCWHFVTTPLVVRCGPVPGLAFALMKRH